MTWSPKSLFTTRPQKPIDARLADGVPEPALHAYPNPASGKMFLAWEVPMGEAGLLTIFNTGMQRVLEFDVPKGKLGFEVDVTGLPSGLYNVNLAGTQYRAAARVLVEQNR